MSPHDFKFQPPAPVPDLRWGVYVEERSGITPVNFRLFASDDPGEAWAHLETLVPRMTRHRLFYVKERGHKQRWTRLSKAFRYLFSHSRRRPYGDYEDFLDYVLKRQPPPSEPDEKVPPEIILLPEPQSVWKYSKRPRSPRF